MGAVRVRHEWRSDRFWLAQQGVVFKHEASLSVSRRRRTTRGPGPEVRADLQAGLVDADYPALRSA